MKESFKIRQKYAGTIKGGVSGTPSGKEVYLTVYPSSRPYTDTIFRKHELVHEERKIYTNF